LAPTPPVPLIENVQVLAFWPPLEQAPDQIASPPLSTRKVMSPPVVNPAVRLLPKATLIPAGLDTTRSPLRPLAVTVSAAAAAVGFTNSTAMRVAPAKEALIGAEVAMATAVVVMAKLALVAPGGTVTTAGLSESVASALAAAAGVTVLNRSAVSPPVPGSSSAAARRRDGGSFRARRA
jgi:hypothetical protein